MLPIDRTASEPLYEQIYRLVKDRIEKGILPAGTRLPSVRALAAENGVSKITVEQAYTQLAAEGYIEAHNRAPYEVAAFPDMDQPLQAEKHVVKRDTVLNRKRARAQRIQYNFATGAMDPEGFDYARWKRFIGYVLRNPENLMGYGDPQGEYVLRLQLADYLGRARGVVCDEDRIVIGSGTQMMIILAASLLRQKGIHRIGMDSSLYEAAAGVFEDHGFQVMPIGQERTDLKQILLDKHIDLYYCTPSHGDKNGAIMSAVQRTRLLQWLSESKGYLIEDDYDSELRYYGRPISSLQGMASSMGSGDHVIYLGAPSKVLPPAIRLSYMVLPDSLLEQFQNRQNRYRQSASVMEELVWAKYMESGEWDKQVRRLRKHYAQKSKYFVSLLNKYLGHILQVTPPTGGVYVAVHFLDPSVQAEQAKELADKQGCAVRIDHGQVLLSFSAIAEDQLEQAVEQLAIAWSSELKGRAENV